MIHKFNSHEFFSIHNVKLDSILDIGARKGDWTKEFKKHYPNSKYLMIEANADHANDLKEVAPYIISLVGKNNSEVNYYVCEDKQNDHGNGIYKENTNVPFTSVKRKQTTIDSLLPGQRFDLIKMDVQGAELDIIQGSPGLIHNAKYLWLELQSHNYNIGAPLAGKVIGYLHEIGFDIAIFDEISIGGNAILGMDIIFVNTRNEGLETGYNINNKLEWSGYNK